MVLYEDNHIISVNKKTSEIVQGDKTGDTTLAEKVKLFLKKKYDKQGNIFLGITHRLDRPVSGVILFAKTSKALSRLNLMFKDKTIKKTYFAIVRNKPPKEKDKLTHFIFRDTKQNKSYAYDKERENTKKALLTYEIIKKYKHYFLLKINLETGRHHQIRSQLSKINCSIVGDVKYNYPKANENLSIYLHAKEIEFIHPVKKEKIKIIANFPNYKLWNFFS